ncbi:WD40 repeat domain-containing protein, partial [Crocosphaera sp.]|uniref:WD40 repeat domain-containing protein n=1 Tax=Crocosphaera sp. TaxID=2729996 RepID=UPI0026133070
MGAFSEFYQDSPAELENFLANLVDLIISPNLEHKVIYYDLLTTFDFLEDKINHPKFELEALIRDYNLIDEVAEVTLNSEQLKTLKFIQRTLQLSSHILNEDRKQLVGQLWGRLQGFNYPDIKRLLKDAEDSNSKKTWLRPLIPSLTTPDSSLICTFTGHKDSVRAVSVTPDGKQAVSASSDNTLKLWDLATGQELLTLIGHHSLVRAVSVTPDGKQAVSASSDNTLKLWDLATGQELLTLTGHKDSVRAVSVTPDGKQAVSASSDNTLKLWDLATGQELLTLTGHK